MAVQAHLVRYLVMIHLINIQPVGGAMTRFAHAGTADVIERILGIVTSGTITTTGDAGMIKSAGRFPERI